MTSGVPLSFPPTASAPFLSPEGEGNSTPAPCPANEARGEIELRVGGMTLVVRPTFAGLVAAEGELGPLFALVERAAEGHVSLHETAALLWHCLRDVPAALTRELWGDHMLRAGLKVAMPVLGRVLRQVVAGV